MGVAKVILSARANSFPFEDRLLCLEVPAKIGRSQRDDPHQCAESGNGLFDCKVLSRHHAMILFEDGHFYLLDTGSSNGTFVNNIRLSRSGQESKMTELFSGDVLRFGSDVMDKSAVQQQANGTLKMWCKCVVASISLYFPDGSEAMARPATSRLYRRCLDNQAQDYPDGPEDHLGQDVGALAGSLKDALRREKLLDERVARVRAMISKNIGRSQTDLMRAFEDIKEELMGAQEGLVEDGQEVQQHGDIYEAIDTKLAEENLTLSRRLKEMNLREPELRNTRESLKAAETDLANLRETSQKQAAKIAELERVLSETNECWAASTKELETKHAGMIQEQEDAFAEERASLRERMQEAVSHEVDLLNRIKSMEADSGYSRAEVDKVLSRERQVAEAKQRFQYRIECLEAELEEAKRMIQEQAGQAAAAVQRSPGDVETIADQEAEIARLKDEVAYIRQELIEARAHKSASDDELGNVRGQLDTLQNTISSLSEDGNRLRKQIGVLEENLAVKLDENSHLGQLVASMEQASTSHNEQSRVLIFDLKAELAKAQRTLEDKVSETTVLLRDLRAKDEVIQQREIDISCLNGKVQDMEDEVKAIKASSSDALSIKEANRNLSDSLSKAREDLANQSVENTRLQDELGRQQSLYNELKKMRGKAEEMEFLQALEKESRDAHYRIEELAEESRVLSERVEHLTEEKIRLLREVAQLKAGVGHRERATQEPGSRDAVHGTVGDAWINSPAHLMAAKPRSPADAAMIPVGNLRAYEIMLGLSFITVILNWILMQ